MDGRARLLAVAVAAVTALIPGCHKSGGKPLPPDARRPVIRTEAELAAEPDARIDSGQTVPTSEPAESVTQPAAASHPALPVPIQPEPGAIEPGILLVNDTALTVAEILYPLHARIAELRAAQTRAGFLEALQRLLRARVQQEIGALLIYQEATAELSEPQRKAVEEVVEKRIRGCITDEFGGSAARFERHLARHRLTRAQYRANLERELVAQQYTREKFAPQVFVSRHELVAYFRQNAGRFSAAETRELCLIEAPWEAFLPDGTTWAQAAPPARAQAKVQAARHIRAAHAALAERPFEEVAREYSRGVHAAQGGSWGEIARPLQAPYDQISALVFQLEAGRYREPVETEVGWYIVRCGKVTPARAARFADVQEEIRQELLERKFEKLSVAYMMQLAEKATISALDPFLRTCMRRVLAAEADEPANR